MTIVLLGDDEKQDDFDRQERIAQAMKLSEEMVYASEELEKEKTYQAFKDDCLILYAHGTSIAFGKLSPEELYGTLTQVHLT